MPRRPYRPKPMTMTTVQCLIGVILMIVVAALLRAAYLWNSDSKEGREYRRSWKEWKIKRAVRATVYPTCVKRFDSHLLRVPCCRQYLTAGSTHPSLLWRQGCQGSRHEEVRGDHGGLGLVGSGQARRIGQGGAPKPQVPSRTLRNSEIFPRPGQLVQRGC